MLLSMQWSNNLNRLEAREQDLQKLFQVLSINRVIGLALSLCPLDLLHVIHYDVEQQFQPGCCSSYNYPQRNRASSVSFSSRRVTCYLVQYAVEQ